MSEIFEHMNKPRRVPHFAGCRITEIDKQIEQLTLERELMLMIHEKFEVELCPYCGGDGHIMKPIKGCECDGPRMHSCEVCNGTGKINNELKAEV